MSDIISPMSPLGTYGTSNKAATVFPSHVRRTFTRHPADYTGELVRLLDDLATVTHGIAAYVKESDEKMTYGVVGTNPITSAFVTRELYMSLSNDGYACLILARDTEIPLTFPEHVPHGGYVVCLSSLDLEPMLPNSTVAGTVFSIYKRKSSASMPGRYIDLQQDMRDQVAAGYCVYSSATTLTYTMGYGTYSFVLHPVAIQFFLQPNTKIMWETQPNCVYADRQLVKSDTKLGKALNRLADEKLLRNCHYGSVVGNFSYALAQGGIMVYQGVQLLTEAAPLAFIAEQCGAVAVNENGEPIMGMKSDSNPHAKVTMCVGPAETINQLIAYAKEM